MLAASCDIVLKQMPQDLAEDKSAFGQLMHI